MTILVTFFCVTFAVSWALFAAAAAIAGPVPAAERGAVSQAVLLLGVIAPSLVALWLTARAEGRTAVRELLGRIGHLPSGMWWYVFAIAYVAAVKLLVAVVYRVGAGGWPAFGRVPVLLMLGAILVSTPVQAGEEIGWRGFALPRLAVRLGLPRASILLGVLWAGWHLPLFFILTGDTLHQSFPVYLLQVTALSIIFAWLYWRSGGSLLLVMLMHAAVNNTKDIVPSAVPGATDAFSMSASPVAWLTVTIFWITAGYFLIRMRGVRPARFDQLLTSATHKTPREAHSAAG